MIDSVTHSTDLVGYLTFDIVARQGRLTICESCGHPLRDVSLVPVGPFARFMLRLGIRLGRYGRRLRAIALDDCDTRSFSVWISPMHRVVVTDERGEHWLQSLDETTAALRRMTANSVPCRGVSFN